MAIQKIHQYSNDFQKSMFENKSQAGTDVALDTLYRRVGAQCKRVTAGYVCVSTRRPAENDLI
jgi:hypothetical protein